MKKYMVPSIKTMEMAVASAITASTGGDFKLDENGVYDVYAPLRLINFD